MTDPTNNFNDSPRECLEHYATRRPDSIMGYRPTIDNELTRHFVALGALEWRSIDGVKYCKTTSDGRRMLEEYWHGVTKAQLDAANQRIAELEAVCREVVDRLGIRYVNRVKSGIRVDADWTGYYKANSEDHEDYVFLARLLDTLPDSR